MSAICQALQLGPEDCPLAESLILNPSGIINILEDNLILFSQRAALHISKDQWLRLQTADDGISPLLPYLRQGIRPSKREKLGMSRTSRLLVREWGKLVLKGGIVYRRSQVNNQNVLQLILPSGMKEEVIAGLHDDVGHMGEDRVHELALLRFYWSCMARDIKKYIQRCQRCICRKTLPTAQPVAPLVNIESKQRLDLLCIDFLSIERSKGGIENVLVVTDHSTRYSVAIPTRNQTANTTARALFNGFIAHYGFPARLHVDQGRNFESKVIKELCDLARTSKSRTTPYHPAGNGLCKRFNRTLLNMLGTLSDVQKQDLKSYLPAMTHAYNSTQHSSTGYSPFYLMFVRQPRLAIDVCLDLEQVTESSGNEETSYIKSLRQRLSMAFELAVEASRKANGKQKKQYDRKARSAVLQPGDLVLVRLLAFQGKHKLSNRWEKEPYIVVSQPDPSIPVHLVKLEKGPGRKRTVHRNLLLPLGQLPHNTQTPIPVQPENDLQHSSEHDGLQVDPPLSVSSEYEGDSSSDDLPVVESDSERSRNTSHDKHVTPTSSSSEGHPIRRSTRQRRRPQWMRDGHYIHQHTISNKHLPLPEWEWKSNFLRVIKPFLRIPIILDVVYDIMDGYFILQ